MTLLLAACSHIIQDGRIFLKPVSLQTVAIIVHVGKIAIDCLHFTRLYPFMDMLTHRTSCEIDV